MKSIHGFTLLELLVVLTIIGILSAITVPQYNAYKRRGFDARALSDLRNVAIAEEAHFMDEEEYLSCVDDECSTLPGIPGISEGVTINMAANGDTFTGVASHLNGTGKVFTWDSERGGLQ